VPSSGGDTIDDQPEDTKPSLADLEQGDPSTPDAGSSNLTPSSKPGRRGKGTPGAQRKGKGRKSAGSHVWISEGPADGTEDEGSVASFSKRKKSEETPDPPVKTVGTAVGTRRQANGTVGSVYSGSKVKHIKKEDGTPLWRKEIQYEFLRLVIDDTTPVFTRFSDGKKGFNFADIYIDCLAKSSKTSKILKDRLQVERQAAQNMAMICLLVNVGRMNTTLNFFPEMRAQLRTYHSIPSLQAYKSQRDYKSLQDAPRLKSILKGASEDDDHPRAIPTIKHAAIPRTNAVNLIFVISQYAPKVSEQHFIDKVDFFDLAMRSTISSKSRARAFLWLMWWYLESDFSKEAALNNPFGPGEYREGQDKDDQKEVPILVPALEHITEEEGDAENVDTEEEKEFAEKMTAERKRLLAENANDPPLTMADPSNPDHKVVKRLKKGAGAYDDDSMMSDVDSRASPGVGMGRSPGPEGLHTFQGLGTAQGAQADSLDDDFEVHDPHPGRGRYKRVRGMNTPSRSKGGPRKSGEGTVRSLLKGGRATGTPDRFTPQPLQPGSGHAVISQFGGHKSKIEIEAMQGAKFSEAPAQAHKPRARTHYQRELEEHKNKRIEWAVRRRRRRVLREAQEVRERSRWLLRAARRVADLDATYDSEDEAEGGGMYAMGGVMGRRWAGVPEDAEDQNMPPGLETDDWGEEAEMWLKVVSRAGRRLDTWGGDREINAYSARVARGNGQRPGVYMARPPGINTSIGMTDGRPGGVMSAPVSAKEKQHLDEEITEDLLAERSEDDDDEEMVDDGEPDRNPDGDVGADEGSDGDVEMD
jgi:Ino eighty subunit 1